MKIILLLLLMYNGIFYIANFRTQNSTNETIYKTTDFQNYTLVYSHEGNSDNFYGSYADGSSIVFVGIYGLLVSSTDGINWNRVIINNEMSMLKVTRIDKVFYIFPENSIIYYISNDLSAFTEKTSPQFNGKVAFIVLYMNYLYYCGSAVNVGGFLGGDIESYTENIINKISASSDMGLNIKKGKNAFIVEGTENTKAYILFRQKYIGV